MKYKKSTFFTFILPALAAFTFIVIIPFFRGIISSFTDWDNLTKLNGDNSVGFDNYKRAFQDDAFMKSFAYTIKYSILSIIGINVVGLGLAVLLRKAFKGRNAIRSAFFLPNLIGGIIIGYAWQVLFSEGFRSLGIKAWLTDSTNTFWSMVIVTTWQYAGYAMIIFSAALQNVPKDQEEAARISGSNKWRVFRKVTLPNLMPAFTVTLFIALTRSIKIFALTVSLTNGGQFDSTTVSYNIYTTAWFENSQTVHNFLGLAQAKSIIFTIFITTIAVIQVRFTKRREINA